MWNFLKILCRFILGKTGLDSHLSADSTGKIMQSVCMIHISEVHSLIKPKTNIAKFRLKMSEMVSTKGSSSCGGNF